jgi:PAS domain S-box-containing protein
MNNPETIKSELIKALSNCEQAVMHAENEMQLLQEVCRIIINVAGYRMAWVGIAEQNEKQTVRPLAFAGVEDGYIETLKITWADTERGRGPSGTAIRMGKPSFCRNMFTDPSFAPWRDEALKRGYRSSGVFPLIKNGKTFGALSIYAGQLEAFDVEDTKLLTALADELAFGISALREREERKRAEEVLRESEQKYHDLVEHANDGILIIQDDIIKFANTRMAHMWGGGVEEILGTNFAAHIHPDALPKVADYYRRRMAGESVSMIYETVLQKKDGSARHAELNAGVIVFQGKPADLVFVRDITERKQTEEERTRLLNVLEKSFNEIYVFDPATLRFQYVNTGALRNLGYSREQILSMTPLDLMPEFNETSFHELIGPLIKQQTEILVFQTVHRRADTTLYPVEVYLKLVENGNERVFLAVIIDITERKRAEEARSRLASIVEYSEDAIIGKTIDGIIFSWNPGAEKLYGYSAKEVLGKPISIIVPPDQFNEMPTSLERIKRGETIERYEAVRLRKDGQYIDVAITISPIKDPEGRITGASTIAHDITEHKKMEKQLHEASLYARNLIETSLDLLVTINSEGKITDVNKATISVTGFSREELIGSEFSDYFTEPEKAREVYQEVFQKGFVRNHLLAIKHRSGNVTDVLYNASVNKNEAGDVVGVFAAARDVTERKLAEEELLKHRDHLEELVKERTAELVVAKDRAEAADKLKSIFIASMSHELRTPLNSIIGFTGMTLQGLSGELNEEQKDNLSRVSRSARHLLELITDVIDISKIEAGRIEVFPAAFLLSPLIAEVISSIAPQVKEKGLELVVDVPPDIKMNTDRKRLLQCIINYLSNAVKFTEAGSITISVKEINGDLELSVIDNGIGIAEKDIPRLFKAFERLETHLQIKAGGTGLGLYLTKKMATELLRGSVGVKSVEGKGSTFSIRIPKILRKEGENK